MGAPAQANSTELPAPNVYLGHNTRIYTCQIISTLICLSILVNVVLLDQVHAALLKLFREWGWKHGGHTLEK